MLGICSRYKWKPDTRKYKFEPELAASNYPRIYVNYLTFEFISSSSVHQVEIPVIMQDV